MKVAYVFAMPRCGTFKVGQMILPQLEAGTHAVEVAGIFFFDDNVFVLRKATRLENAFLQSQIKKTYC